MGEAKRRRHAAIPLLALSILFAVTSASAEVIEVAADQLSHWCRTEAHVQNIWDAATLDRAAASRRLAELERIGLCGQIPVGTKLRFNRDAFGGPAAPLVPLESITQMTFPGSQGVVWVQTQPGYGPFSWHLLKQVRGNP